MPRISTIWSSCSRRWPRKRRTGPLRWLGLVLALLLGAEALACAKPLRYRIDVATMLAFERADLAWLQRVVKSAGCELLISPDDSASTSRRLRQIEAGTTDILMNASKLPERTVYAWFSAPYAAERAQLLVRKAELARWRGMDLNAIVAAGGRISGPLTGWFGEQYQQFRDHYRRDPRFVPYVYLLSDGINALNKHRADVLVVSDRQLQGVAASSYWGLEVLVADLGGAPVHVMISKRGVSAADFQRLNQAINAALAAGDHP